MARSVDSHKGKRNLELGDKSSGLAVKVPRLPQGGGLVAKIIAV